jgi:L-lactate dehydrogenase complex protein LldE
MANITKSVPSNRDVQLFATCLGDLLFPEAVNDAYELLVAAGFDVYFPPRQVCCGQPAFNAGHRKAARRVARTFVRAFDAEVPVVLPSGSCAAMLKNELRELIPSAPRYTVLELSELLVRHASTLAAVNVGKAVVYHDSCHMARGLGIRDAPRQLLRETGAEVRELSRPDLCCGFGGTFSIRNPELSVAMADDKLGQVGEAEALVTSDPGCLMHLLSRARKTNARPVVHLATALRRGL